MQGGGANYSTMDRASSSFHRLIFVQLTHPPSVSCIHLPFFQVPPTLPSLSSSPYISLSCPWISPPWLKAAFFQGPATPPWGQVDSLQWEGSLPLLSSHVFCPNCVWSSWGTRKQDLGWSHLCYLCSRACQGRTECKSNRVKNGSEVGWGGFWGKENEKPQK